MRKAGVMAELDPAFEQQLADLSDDDWRSLSARVRPPTSADSLKAIAAKHIPEDQLQTFMAIANVKAFADASGNVDESKVQQLAGTLFGAREPQQQGTQAKWGQRSAGGAPGKQPGDDGRAALAARHGVKRPDRPDAAAGIRPGANGRAELERRHGVKGKR
jgi:hypothetical protein